MSPTELKQNLVKQYNEVATQLQQLQGAIAACDELLKEESTEETTED